MTHQLRLLVVAVQFLTRLPVPTLRDFDPAWTTAAARWFPLVGVLIGALGALVFVAGATVWPPSLAALVSVAATVLLTGAFHEDGLADAAAGLVGGTTRARRLEIMKDSRIGTYGALALLLVVGVRVQALASLPVTHAVAALVVAHAGGRAAAVVVMRRLPYAGDRDWAKVKPVADGVTPIEVVVAVATALLATLPLAWLDPRSALVAVAAGTVATALLAVRTARSIGGWVGDTLGAGEQCFEAACLLGVAAVAP